MKQVASFEVNGETVARLMIDDNEVYHAESTIYGDTKHTLGRKTMTDAINAFTSVIKFETIMKTNKLHKIRGE